MSLHSIFKTPVWEFEKKLPEGVYEWALDFKSNNSESINSNRGGYQSISQHPKDFPYQKHISSMLPRNTFSNTKVDSWWLNVNEKGDYNVVHTHPESHFACIWYITNNEGSLILSNPLMHTRVALHLSGFPVNVKEVVNCSAGTLLVFPSDIPHCVEEHHLDTPRISVSFNLRITH